MPSFLLGKDAKAYYSSVAADGSNAAAVIAAGTVAGNIMDLSLDVESDFVDATTRSEAAAGFRSQIAVLKNSNITFDARWIPADPFFAALLVAWDTNAEITFYAFDQAHDVSGAQGLMANFTVGFTKEEPLNDVQKVSVTLSASSFPTWETIA